MARPATGSVRWNPRAKRWEARVTLPGGQRKLVPLTHPPIAEGDLVAAEARALAITHILRERAGVTRDKSETLNEWVKGWFTEREKRGLLSVADSRARFGKWVSPIIGTMQTACITPDDLRRVVTHLTRAISRKDISAKTAGNVWGDITKMFSDACEHSDTEIRVREDNPAEKVRGPAKGIDRSKPFLRPDELTQLLACEEAPLARRRLYALAAYTGARIGELRALTRDDVDFEAMQIIIAKQRTRRGVVRNRTKTGRARAIPIEPSLLPLLRVLVDRPGKHPALLPVGNTYLADRLRDDLRKAGCTREALFADDEMRSPMRFHNLRDTCLTHMAVRRDPPQDIQWRAGHTTPAMTERYIAEARFVAGATFGAPLPELPSSLLGQKPARVSVSIGSESEQTAKVLPFDRLFSFGSG